MRGKYCHGGSSWWAVHSVVKVYPSSASWAWRGRDSSRPTGQRPVTLIVSKCCAARLSVGGTACRLGGDHRVQFANRLSGWRSRVQLVPSTQSSGSAPGGTRRQEHNRSSVLRAAISFHASSNRRASVSNSRSWYETTQVCGMGRTSQKYVASC